MLIDYGAKIISEVIWRSAYDIGGSEGEIDCSV